MDGRGYLENLIAKRISQATRNPESSPAIDRSEIRGIAMGLAVAGVLSPTDKDQLLALLDVALTDAGLMQTRHFDMTSVPSDDERLRMALAASRASQGGNTHRRGAGPEPSMPRLLRVVSLHHRDINAGAGRIVPVSLEVWSHFLTLRIGYLSTQTSAADRMMNHRKWYGQDDTLTTYDESHSYWSDAHGCIVETRVFTPAPPPAATTLTLQTGTPGEIERLELPLT